MKRGDIALSIPDVPPSPNRVLGRHWSAKAGEKNKWVLWIRSQLLPMEEVPFQRKRVKITLHHSRLYDKDNAYGACKPIVDALKAWNLIWDDSPEFVQLTVEQAKCPHKQRHTEIEIEQLFGGRT